MLSLADLRAGDVGFADIAGAAGILVWAGETILAQMEHNERKIKHVLVVTEVSHSTGRGDHAFGPMAVQAMPHGAEEIELGAEHWTSEFTYFRPDYQRWLNPASMLNLPYKAGVYGFEVAEAARKYIGTPYSFLDYAAILGLHAGIRNGPIRRYVTTSKHMICSQLADQSMADAGFHVFNDKRLPQDVMPIELYRALLAKPGQFYVPGFDGWRGCGPNTAYA